MKKKTALILIIIAVILILSAAAAVLLTPQTFFTETSDIEIYRVIKTSAPYGKVDERTEITDQVDGASLESCLYLMRCNRYRTSFAPYATADVRYEIDLRYNSESFHIVLGKPYLSVIYVSADKGGYKIANPESWLSLLDALTTD